MQPNSWLKRSYDGAKVPSRIGSVFWLTKICTTAGGETASDWMVHHGGPIVAVVLSGVAFCVALFFQFRARSYTPLRYWCAVSMVSVFGTVAADVVHVGLGVPYVVSSIVFTVVLLVTFWVWLRQESTISIHSITTSTRELFYWIAVTCTFALGTALGDLTAVTFRWGYLASGILFTVAFLAPGVAYAVARRHAIGAFWLSYVVTRPMGASFADYLGKSRAHGGLAFGTGNATLVLGFAITVLVLLQQRRLHTSSLER